ncbi:DUF1801 domain-containing protein [Blastopirellula marina]|uniref:YdhG-like domain-containing protein n=1 Tax=Blastopirellula marina TaxID=124 RepID=A0A2S8G9C0_9BACT|nr:DUF1801 domain-containing protein [Blastopirellula marina]PQO41058.1 hypothetical protein C5Y98_03600 [Blastopirellula marina]PTL45934.1 hypothetical protein C5Y97_03600 [Blastopirellula marina]
MGEKNPQVDQFFSGVKQWKKELTRLREIVLETKLTEELKWRAPCYTDLGKNIVILGGFKAFCSLNFFKGALLKDPQGVLVRQGENTRSARIMRFTSEEEIVTLKATIKAYIREAINVEKSGEKVALDQDSEIETPDEFQKRLDDDSALRAAFEALTPGRQRAYLLHFSGAKQSKSRESRIDKCLSRIFDGKGLHDCTCGLSNRLPTCDGSHKQLKS